MTGMLSTQEHRLKVEGFCAGFQTDCQGSTIAAVIEAHETEKESYDKTCELLSSHPRLSGIYVSTVNCLPVCRALEDRGRAGQVALITTDLFPEMVRHLRSGTIRASIYQNPYLQGQVALRLLVDNLLNGMAIPHASYLNPGIVLRTNVHLFREAQEIEPLPQAGARKIRSFGS
jgi:LacI family transcriptional regulator